MTKCVDALKDLSDNITDEDRYSSLLSIITERLDCEFTKLMNLSKEKQ